MSEVHAEKCGLFILISQNYFSKIKQIKFVLLWMVIIVILL